MQWTSVSVHQVPDLEIAKIALGTLETDRGHGRSSSGGCFNDGDPSLGKRSRWSDITHLTFRQERRRADDRDE